MNFLYPGFLFGLFAVAIPVIIHLFNFRRYKKIYFTNVRFLKEVKQESESKSKLRHLLILLARILAVSCLVFAFAQPFIPAGNTRIKKGNKAISVYIDNSFSMESVNKNGLLLDNAKTRAKEIASAFQPSDRFQLLTNDFEGRHQRLLSREEFLEAIEEVKISPAFRSLKEVYMRQHDVLESSGAADRRLFIISDFQRSFFNPEQLNPDTAVTAVLIPVQANSNDNVYIDTCWFENPVQQSHISQQLHVRIVNGTEKNIENASLKLYLNGQQVAPASYNVDANSKTEVILPFLIKQNGIQQCRVAIEDHPVSFDDELFFSFSVNSNIPCLVIQGEKSAASGYFRSLMQNDSLFAYSECAEKSVDYSRLKKSNLVVLNELSTLTSGMVHELNTFIRQGGSVLLFPAPQINPAVYNEFFTITQTNGWVGEDTLNTRVDKINTEQGLYSGVFEKQQENMDMPKVFSHYTTTAGSRSGQEILLKLLNGNSFLSRYACGKGNLYVCTAPLNDKYSSFARHALFVPTIIKIAINSVPAVPLYYETGRNLAINMSATWGAGKEQPVHISAVDGKYDFIPEKRITENAITLYTQNQATVSGNYLSTEEKEVFCRI